MTVKELIEYLKPINPEAKVTMVVGAEGGGGTLYYFDKFAISASLRIGDENDPINYRSIGFMKLLDEDDLYELYSERFNDEEE